MGSQDVNYLAEVPGSMKYFNEDQQRAYKNGLRHGKMMYDRSALIRQLRDALEAVSVYFTKKSYGEFAHIEVGSYAYDKLKAAERAANAYLREVGKDER